MGFSLRDQSRYGFFSFKYEENCLIFFRTISGFGEEYYLFDEEGNFLGWEEYDPCESDEIDEICIFNVRDDKSGLWHSIEVSDDKLAPITIEKDSELYKKIKESF